MLSLQKSVLQFLKKLKIELLYDQESPLLGIHINGQKAETYKNIDLCS